MQRISDVPGRISDLWSVDSETHLGKQNRCSGSWERPRRSCIADCISCISASYFCISEVPGQISDLTSRTASIRRFRNSPRKAKLEFWIKSYGNWEPEIITIFVTWQSRVTLDSIWNFCDVLSHLGHFRWFLTFLLLAFSMTFGIFGDLWHTRLFSAFLAISLIIAFLVIFGIFGHFW